MTDILIDKQAAHRPRRTSGINNTLLPLRHTGTSKSKGVSSQLNNTFYQSIPDMHSALNRAQAVFGFFTTVALCVAAVAALSVLLMPADAARADVELKNVQV